jgi:hypothetical protein
MHLLKKFPLTPFQLAAVLAPIGLWMMVWAGMQSGEIRLLFEWDGLSLFLNRFRATVPLFAGYTALMVIAINLYWRRPAEFNLVGPLGFTVIYGLVGGIAAAASPLIPIALYWVGVYTSVPLVLLAIMWGPNGPERIHRLIRFNTLFILFLVILFFFVAVRQLDLASQLFDKSTWFNCSLDKPWFGLDFGPVDFLPLGDGLLRPTGVGRFSALIAIIAMTSVAAGSWRHDNFDIRVSRGIRVFWAIIFFGALIILWTTGARTAIVGFLGAIVIIGGLYGYFFHGPKVLIGGTLGVLILGSALLTTGVPQGLLRGCITSSTYTAGTSLLSIKGDQVNQVPDATPVPTVIPGTTVNQVPAVEATPVPGSTAIARPKPTPTLDDDKGGGFFAFSGRTIVWEAAWVSLKDSPFFGYGFHSDRLILGTHMHNSYLHALYQTGFIGIIPFMVALIFTWILLLKSVINLRTLPTRHKHLVIQSAGIIVFFSARTISESTVAFFGIDWLILAPIMMYLQIASNLPTQQESEA